VNENQKHRPIRSYRAKRHKSGIIWQSTIYNIGYVNHLPTSGIKAAQKRNNMAIRNLWYWVCQSLIEEWHETATKKAQYGDV
jgi:hypothetical protein